MKSVMISIKPSWCKRIMLKEKTVEIRRTRPILDTPFRCYIYCTAERGRKNTLLVTGSDGADYALNGRVIGEFTCKEIQKISRIGSTGSRQPEVYNATRYENGIQKQGMTQSQLLETSCLTFEEMDRYLHGFGFVWIVSDLHIYGIPRELRWFKKWHDDGMWSTLLNVERPPQSWGYVEELK